MASARRAIKTSYYVVSGSLNACVYGNRVVTSFFLFSQSIFRGDWSDGVGFSRNILVLENWSNFPGNTIQNSLLMRN